MLISFIDSIVDAMRGGRRRRRRRRRTDNLM